MRRPDSAADELFSELLAAGESLPRLRELLRRRAPEEADLIAVLRRAVPVTLLRHLAATPPWSERPSLLAAVAKNPRSPRAQVLAVLGGLYWRDLAEVAAAMHLAPAVRFRAEALLVERLDDLRLGDRIALARLATAAVLRPLLADTDARVVRTALQNPRLTSGELGRALQATQATELLTRETAEAWRFRESYPVRLALVLQPRTPLAVSLAQLSSLNPVDLRRVKDTAGLPPLVQLSAERLLQDAQKPRRLKQID